MITVVIAGTAHTVNPRGRVELIATRRDAARWILAFCLAGLLLAGTCSAAGLSVSARGDQLAVALAAGSCAFGAAGVGCALVLIRVRALRRDPAAWKAPARPAPWRTTDVGASWSRILRPPRLLGPLLVGISATGFLGSILLAVPVAGHLEVLGLVAVGLFLACLVGVITIIQFTMVWSACAMLVHFGLTILAWTLLDGGSAAASSER